ncbi:hypothetical protein AB0M29_07380 [Streptomyces sp. NPDC051976]|uniref:hypothetical protein n=1 Tax=Streptomyces sp. NPDC051976 TaxID=3154947 RepID=UPI003422050F
MDVLGVSVGFSGVGRRPVITCVVLSGSYEDPIYDEGCELKTAETEIVDQIDDLGRKLSSKLSARTLGAVVIRIADMAPTGSRAVGPRRRLMIEGALAYVCKTHKIPKIFYRSGKEVGEALGISKADALQLGKDLDSKRPEATSAALSALPKPSQNSS